jgi:hypothetical protein
MKNYSLRLEFFFFSKTQHSDYKSCCIDRLSNTLTRESESSKHPVASEQDIPPLQLRKETTATTAFYSDRERL